MEEIIDTLTNAELAILGLVAEHPKHGYQIEQDIAARGFREWTEIGFSSIYYVLNKLESAGWLASERGWDIAAAPTPAETAVAEAAAAETATADAAAAPGQPDRERRGPARRVYHLTAAGWAGYHDAVRERLAHPRPRTGDFDLALANLPALGPEEARAALDTYHAFLQERLALVRAKWDQDRAAADLSHPFPAHVDALFDHSVKGIEAELKWVEEYIKRSYANP